MQLASLGPKTLFLYTQFTVAVLANQEFGLLINAKRLWTNLSHVTQNDSY